MGRRRVTPRNYFPVPCSVDIRLVIAIVSLSGPSAVRGLSLGMLQMRYREPSESGLEWGTFNRGLIALNADSNRQFCAHHNAIGPDGK